MAKIIFKNGTELTADVNGSCYITDTKPDFPSDLSLVRVEDEDGQKTFQNVQVIECFSVDGRYWFGFREISPEEQWKADIEDALCDLSREGVV